MKRGGRREARVVTDSDKGHGEVLELTAFTPLRKYDNHLPLPGGRERSLSSGSLQRNMKHRESLCVAQLVNMLINDFCGTCRSARDAFLPRFYCALTSGIV